MLFAMSLLLFVISIITFYITRIFSFWKDRGFPYIKGYYQILSLDVFLLKTDPSHFFKNIYLNNNNLPYVGIYLLHTPKLVVNDLELIKNVLVRDFQYFQSRNEVVDPKLDSILSKSILMLHGSKWRFVRTMITPSFTSGKIKAAFNHVDKCGQDMVQYLQKLKNEGKPCQLKDTMSRFTAQAIVGYIMGIEIDNFGASESPMITYLKKIIALNVKQELTLVLMAAIPKLQQLLRMKFIDDDVTHFFRQVVFDTFKYREENGIFRNDFMQNIIEMRKNDEFIFKQKFKREGNVEGLLRMDDEDILSQFGTLLIAGFETSASTLTFGVYELALSQEIQSRLRKEIEEVLEKHSHKVTFDALQEMKYLDMVVSEILRKYPIVGFLDRSCSVDYELPAPSGKGSLILPKGTGIFIPVLGIHYDPEFYPEPEKFDPERFTEEKKQKRPQFAYLPFGNGPRICIGLQFALLGIKVVLTYFLRNFKVVPCPQTPLQMVYDHKSFLLRPLQELPVELQPLHNKVKSMAACAESK